MKVKQIREFSNTEKESETQKINVRQRINELRQRE
jgi:hypothetical protein